MKEAKALWMLEFYPTKDEVPNHENAVLVSDGKDIGLAFYHDGRWWDLGDDCQPEEWPGVIGWAELPNPRECIEDLLPGESS